MILLGAAMGCASVAAVLMARRRDWPIEVIVLCWMPALLLLSFRLDPRPEIFSLFYLGCYLAILRRAEERPKLLWLLPLVQVLWSNVQGLFILGPLLMGMFVLAQAVRFGWMKRSGQPIGKDEEKQRWKQISGASIAVAAACFVNPYGIQGVLFPFDLFPKIADPNNPYKKYIEELQSPSDFVRLNTVQEAGRNWFLLALYFLLPLVLLSFVYPALWRAWSAAQPSAKNCVQTPVALSTPATATWIGALAVVIALLAVGAVTLSGNGPSWLTNLGDNVPLLLLAISILSIYFVSKRDRAAAAVAGLGGAAMACVVLWLDVKLLGRGRGLLSGIESSAALTLTLLFVVVGGVAGILVLRWGSSLFRLLLAGSFAYLSLLAVQNWSRFALVAGCILMWNFAEWAAEIRAATPPSRKGIAVVYGFRVLLIAVLGLWVTALVNDQFYIHAGLSRHFAFREEPLAFAHDAAVFAGQPGLPDRALVYALDQTGVYDFHNAPRCKPFLDGRLEMPDLATFNTYVAIENWLKEGDPRWEKAVADLGNPLLFLSHKDFQGRAEAMLLTHPHWRCLYYDALAVVFVPRSQAVSPVEFPDLDFGALHFREAKRPSVPNVRRSAALEEKALYNLAASLPNPNENIWQRRIPILLCALDRAQIALEEVASQANVWILLGNSHLMLNPDPFQSPPSLAQAWNVERGIWWAQATYCYRRAVDLQPKNATACAIWPGLILSVVCSRRNLPPPSNGYSTIPISVPINVNKSRDSADTWRARIVPKPSRNG